MFSLQKFADIFIGRLNCTAFYEKLNSYDIPKLNKQESDLLGGPLNKLEVYNFLKNMKNDKSPGPDGFTSEFFKFIFGKT